MIKTKMLKATRGEKQTMCRGTKIRMVADILLAMMQTRRQWRDIFKALREDFPGGSVVKNPPANAGDTGSSPCTGRSHMPWIN